MAKKDPTDLTVEKKLETLFQLQTTLSQIDEKRALRGELPLEVQDLEDEIAGLATRVEKIEAEIAEFRAAITQKKGDIADAENIVARYKEQLNDARNNREYDMLSKEIVFQELEIELCNKKIKEALAKIEEREATLQQAQKLMEERKQVLVEKQGELEAIMQETREEEDKLKEKSKALEEKIEAVPCASREKGTRSPSVANCTSPETPSRKERESGGVSAPASATSARPLRRSSIAARMDAMPDSAPPSSVVAPPENEHSRAMPLAIRLPDPERKLAGSGAGSEPTSSARTD